MILPGYNLVVGHEIGHLLGKVLQWTVGRPKHHSHLNNKCERYCNSILNLGIWIGEMKREVKKKCWNFSLALFYQNNTEKILFLPSLETHLNFGLKRVKIKCAALPHYCLLFSGTSGKKSNKISAAITKP
jgi:hypothetical protein